MDPQTAPALPGYLGRYRVLAPLGEGGMGTVYLGLDERLGRQVALKVLREFRLENPDFVARFRKEAEVMARLSHPHIMGVLELGEYEDRPFIAMEYFPGEPIDAWCLRRGTQADRIAALVADVADALQCAHEGGVVHRDVKPGNILVDEAGLAKLTDFGLARMDDDAREQRLTQSTTILGTVYYMSPEQASGGARDCPPQSDVFSLGVVLYELLLRRLPFMGDSTLEVLQRIRHDEPPRPRSLDSSLTPDLEAVCLKALEKDPLRRYARAADLAADLRRLLRGEPVLAARPTALRRARRWIRRRPAPFAALVLAAALPLGVGGVWLQQSSRAKAERLARDEARRQAEVELQQVWDLGARSRQADFVSLALTHYDRAIAADPLFARAWAWRGRTRHRLGDWPGAMADYRRALELEPGDEQSRYHLVRLLLLQADRWPGREAPSGSGQRPQAHADGLVDAAQVVLIGLPARLEAGAPFQAAITMRNAGTTTWRADGQQPYKLGAVDEDDPCFPAPRVDLPADATVPPGGTWTFVFNCTAPAQPGRYTSDWQMVHELEHWFGAQAIREFEVVNVQGGVFPTGPAPGEPGGAEPAAQLTELLRGFPDTAEGRALQVALRVFMDGLEGTFRDEVLREQALADLRLVESELALLPDFYFIRAGVRSNRFDFFLREDIRERALSAQFDADIGLKGAGETLEDLDRCLELDPLHAYALFFRGWLRVGLRDLEAARADVQSACDLAPGFVPARRLLARLLFLAGQPEAALAGYDAVIQADPTRKDHAERAGLRLCLGRYAEAWEDARSSRDLARQEKFADQRTGTLLMTIASALQGELQRAGEEWQRFQGEGAFSPKAMKAALAAGAITSRDLHALVRIHRIFWLEPQAKTWLRNWEGIKGTLELDEDTQGRERNNVDGAFLVNALEGLERHVQGDQARERLLATRAFTGTPEGVLDMLHAVGYFLRLAEARYLSRLERLYATDDHVTRAAQRYREGQYALAEDDLRLALERQPGSGGLLYALATVLACRARSEPEYIPLAVDALHGARRHGYRRWADAQEDPDFAPLASDARFQGLWRGEPQAPPR